MPGPSAYLFSPFSSADLCTTLLSLLATFVASGAGLGGGGLLVPLFVFSGFDARHAVPLSEATIFGSMITNLVFNLQKSHPISKNRPLIDFDAAMMLEPSTLVGTIVGVVLNRLLPEWSIVGLLVLLLSYASIRTFNKGLRTYAKENLEASRQMSINASAGVKENKNSAMERIDEATPIAQASTRQRLLDEDSRPSTTLLLLLFLVWLLLTGSSFIKKIFTQIKCGSQTYWELTFIPVVGCIAFLGFAKIRIVSKCTLKHQTGYRLVKGDIDWREGVNKYILLMAGAGVSAGLLGIGGGMVQSPLMLEMGMLPEVQRATSATMILFTASSAALQFLAAGAFPGSLQYDYAIWYATTGVIGTALGQVVMKALLRRYKRASFIIFFLSGVIGLSCIMMAIVGGSNVLDEFRTGKGLGFGSLC